MFPPFLKDFALKKIVKKRLVNAVAGASFDRIRSVGILVDEPFAAQAARLEKALERAGVDASHVRTLIYTTSAKPEINDYDSFSVKDLNWQGNIKPGSAHLFAHTKFDLLINYFDVEKAGLLAVASESPAIFKIGLGNVSPKLNHLIIDASPLDENVFIDELFRYLGILNKI